MVDILSGEQLNSKSKAEEILLKDPGMLAGMRHNKDKGVAPAVNIQHEPTQSNKIDPQGPLGEISKGKIAHVVSDTNRLEIDTFEDQEENGSIGSIGTKDSILRNSEKPAMQNAPLLVREASIRNPFSLLTKKPSSRIKSSEEKLSAKILYLDAPVNKLPGNPLKRFRWAVRKTITANRVKKMKIGFANTRVEKKHTLAERLDRLEQLLFEVPKQIKSVVAEETSETSRKIKVEINKIDVKFEQLEFDQKDKNDEISSRFGELSDTITGLKIDVQDVSDKLGKSAINQVLAALSKIEKLDGNVSELLSMDLDKLLMSLDTTVAKLYSCQATTDKLRKLIDALIDRVDEVQCSANSTDTTALEIMKIDTQLRLKRSDIITIESCVNSIESSYLVTKSSVKAIDLHHTRHSSDKQTVVNSHAIKRITDLLSKCVYIDSQMVLLRESLARLKGTCFLHDEVINEQWPLIFSRNSSTVPAALQMNVADIKEARLAMQEAAAKQVLQDVKAKKIQEKQNEEKTMATIHAMETSAAQASEKEGNLSEKNDSANELEESNERKSVKKNCAESAMEESYANSKKDTNTNLSEISIQSPSVDDKLTQNSTTQLSRVYEPDTIINGNDAGSNSMARNQESSDTNLASILTSSDNSDLALLSSRLKRLEKQMKDIRRFNAAATATELASTTAQASSPIVNSLKKKSRPYSHDSVRGNEIHRNRLPSKSTLQVDTTNKDTQLEKRAPSDVKAFSSVEGNESNQNSSTLNIRREADNGNEIVDSVEVNTIPKNKTRSYDDSQTTEIPESYRNGDDVHSKSNVTFDSRASTPIDDSDEDNPRGDDVETDENALDDKEISSPILSSGKTLRPSSSSRLKTTAQTNVSPLIAELQRLRDENSKLSKKVSKLESDKITMSQVEKLIKAHVNKAQRSTRHDDFRADPSGTMDYMEKSVRDLAKELMDLKKRHESEVASMKQEISDSTERAIRTAVAEVEEKSMPTIMTAKSLCLGCGRSSTVSKEASQLNSPSFLPTLSSSTLPGPDILRGGFKMPVRAHSPPGVITNSLNMGKKALNLVMEFPPEYNKYSIEGEEDLMSLTTAEDSEGQRIKDYAAILNIAPEASKWCKFFSYLIISENNSNFIDLKRAKTVIHPTPVRYAQDKQESESLRPMYRKGFPGKKSMRAEVFQSNLYT